MLVMKTQCCPPTEVSLWTPPALADTKPSGEALHFAVFRELDPLLSLHQVRQATTLSRTSIYRKLEDGTFPRPMKLGPVRIAWRASVIAAWISEQEKAS